MISIIVISLNAHSTAPSTNYGTQEYALLVQVSPAADEYGATTS